MEELPDEEFFEFVERLRDTLDLLRRRGVGEELSEEELERLRSGIRDVLTRLGLKLPLRGVIASRIVSRKPGPLAKAMGIAEAVDEIIALLLRLCREVTGHGMDLRVRNIITESAEDELRNLGSYVGFVCESLGRLWLRDVVGGEWRSLTYFITECRIDSRNEQIEFDAISTVDRGDTLELHLAEIKRTFDDGAARKLKNNLQAFTRCYLKRRREIERAKNFKVASVWIVEFRKRGSEQPPLKKLMEELDDTVHRLGLPEPRLVGLQDIKKRCRQEERVARPILWSLEFLERMGYL